MYVDIVIVNAMLGKHYVIILAAGKGERMRSNEPKQFLILGKKPVLIHSLNAFYNYDKNSVISVVLPKNKINYWKLICKKYNFNLKHNIFIGGLTRYESVRNALNNLNIAHNDMVTIHDGVRPFISKKLITKTFNSAFKKGHAAPFLNLKDSLRKFDKEKANTKSVNRTNFILTQTPQIFRGNIIKDAYKKEKSNKTDDISLIESNVQRVNLIKGEQTNLKITTNEDWVLANLLIKN